MSIPDPNILAQLLEAQQDGNEKTDRLSDQLFRLLNGDPNDPLKPGLLVRIDRTERAMERLEHAIAAMAAQQAKMNETSGTRMWQTIICLVSCIITLIAMAFGLTKR